VVFHVRQCCEWKEATREEYPRFRSACLLRDLQLQLLTSIGGTTESQREFLEGLSAEDSKRNQDRQRKQPPIANNFALGYTYHDVLDADHEGMD